jgi:lysyl endopeptidase
MIIRYLSFIFLLSSVLVLNSSGQVSYGGTPASFSNLKRASITVPVLEMALVSNDELMKEELMMSEPAKSYQFAKSFDTDISPDKDGVWETTKSMKIWRVGIKSKSAYSINIIFDKMMLPTGASIFIYTPDRKILRGAFNANNEQTSGIFPIYPIPGDEIIVEYNEPFDVSFSGILRIGSVNHDYKNAFGDRPLGEAGTCNRDVYCPEAAALKNEKQAVVGLIVNGRELCTGTLVNNVRKDKSPYLLTAGHCIENTTEAQKTVMCFNYESPFCGSNGSTNGYADQTITGTLLKSRSDYLDFALVALENIPPPEFRPYYAGWDNSTTIPSSTSTVHHPKGDVKKVSIDNDPPAVGSYSESSYLKNGFWWIKKWDVGTTESGSSGCPLFNSNKLLIGTLTGGTATCTNSTDDYFSMFGKQWNYYSQSDKQLKKWLDPDNTGALSLESLNPYDSSESCDLFSNGLLGEKYLTQKTSGGKGYISGHNYLKITEYAEKFSQTEKSYISSIAVGIAKAVTGSGSSEGYAIFNIKEEDITDGLPDGTLVSKTIPLSALKSDQTNLIEFDNPVLVTGNYFVTVEINYTDPADTLVIYHTADRLDVNKNRAYAKNANGWQPFYWIPEIGIKASLLINVNGCENELASDVVPEPKPGDKRFSIYYPTDINAEYVYLANAGDEEFGALSIFDASGRKIFTQDRMFTKTLMPISFNEFGGPGIYIIVLETIDSKDVLKVRIL